MFFVRSGLNQQRVLINNTRSALMSTKGLHMVQLTLEKSMLEFISNLVGDPISDKGYLTHCALDGLFQDQSPKPFDLSMSSKGVHVLGYSGEDEEALKMRADLGADPKIHQGVDWDGLASKRMPQSFPEGMDLRFEVQAVPVVTKKSAGEGENQSGEVKTWEKGDEIDAFLSRAWENPDQDLTREGVYAEWIDRILTMRGGAEVNPENVQLSGFALREMQRRTENTREVVSFQQPEARLEGTLTVTDGEEFTDLLMRGIGHQKHFGYGMIKVQPT